MCAFTPVFYSRSNLNQCIEGLFYLIWCHYHQHWSNNKLQFIGLYHNIRYGRRLTCSARRCSQASWRALVLLETLMYWPCSSIRWARPADTSPRTWSHWLRYSPSSDMCCLNTSTSCWMNFLVCIQLLYHTELWDCYNNLLTVFAIFIRHPQNL